MVVETFSLKMEHCFTATKEVKEMLNSNLLYPLTKYHHESTSNSPKSAFILNNL